MPPKRQKMAQSNQIEVEETEEKITKRILRRSIIKIIKKFQNKIFINRFFLQAIQQKIKYWNLRSNANWRLPRARKRTHPVIRKWKKGSKIKICYLNYPKIKSSIYINNKLLNLRQTLINFRNLFINLRNMFLYLSNLYSTFSKLVPVPVS